VGVMNRSLELLGLKMAGFFYVEMKNEKGGFLKWRDVVYCSAP
jgi:hypothetical protein